MGSAGGGGDGSHTSRVPGMAAALALMLRPLPLGHRGCVTSTPCPAGFQGQALSASFLEKCPQTVLECLSVSSRRPAQGLRRGWQEGWRVTPGGAGRSQEKHLPSLPPICPEPHRLAWHRGASGTTAKHGRQRELGQLCQGAQLPRAQGRACLGGEQPCLGASKTKPCWAARAKAVAGTLRTSRLRGGGVRRAHGERCQSRCSAAPPSVRPMVSAGRSRQAQRAKGTGTHDLDWGHQSGGTPLPLQGLWAGSCPMRRVEQQMSIQKEGAA